MVFLRKSKEFKGKTTMEASMSLFAACLHYAMLPNAVFSCRTKMSVSSKAWLPHPTPNPQWGGGGYPPPLKMVGMASHAWLGLAWPGFPRQGQARSGWARLGHGHAMPGQARPGHAWPGLVWRGEARPHQARLGRAASRTGPRVGGGPSARPSSGPESPPLVFIFLADCQL